MGPQEWVNARDDLFDFITEEGANYPGMKVRVPHIFLSKTQIDELAYKPIQEQNYHSPDGGHRLIVFPPSEKGKGLCYMSSDVIGQKNAELGTVNRDGVFIWNEHPLNEMLSYRASFSANVSTDIKGQDEGLVNGDDLVRVSHSFKTVINTDSLYKYRNQNIQVPA